MGMIGQNIPVRDAAMKVTGQLKYTADLEFPGMLHAKILFSPVPHARIKRIDTSRAEALEGVHGVVCYLNSPDTKYNSCGEEIDGHKTERVFDDTVRYVGDKVAAVAADTVKIAEQALKLIQVEYEELPFYTDPREALKEGAYPIHGESNIIFRWIWEPVMWRRGLRQRIIYMKIRIPHRPFTTAPLRHMHPLLSMKAAAS